MEPKNQDCLGHYLYGAGYYARDDNTLGVITGHGSSQPHFCLRCPKRAECETEHELRVRQLRPKEVEQFEYTMRKAGGRGMAPTLAALLLSQEGKDPFAAVAVDNFSKGHADRGRGSGPLVQS